MYTNHNREQLRIFMARHELTSAGVALLLGVEPQTVRTWTSGGPRSISWEQLQRLDQIVYEKRSVQWQKLDAAPVIECRKMTPQGGEQMYLFWCPYCRAEHAHGAPKGGRIHRAAHCNGGRMMDKGWTPYSDHGYILEAK